MITIKGSLERLTYQNPRNHYTVARFRIARINDPVTIVGHLAGVNEGESLEVKGGWVSHPKYGDQFRVDIYKVLLPATLSGIRRYLGSGMIKGISRAMADRIVDYFQDRTLDILENEPDRLQEIHGIGNAKKKMIETAWNRHHAVRKVMQFLQENEVGVRHTATILKAYGSKAIDVIKADPYSLVIDETGVDFETADRIARRAGVEKGDEKRLACCLLQALLSARNDGHVFLYKSDVLQKAQVLSGVPSDFFESVMDEQVEAGHIVTEPWQKRTRVFLSDLYRAEFQTAARLSAIQSLVPEPCSFDPEHITELVFKKLAVKLSKEQIEVVRQVLAEKIVVITGGPGTGKTTLIQALCTVFELEGEHVVLSAPTGRAARRLSEVTGKKAFTLHKLLGFDQENQTFERGADNPLELSVFVVDEASMVDIQLMLHLVQATPVQARLIMVGDTYQLPSVGPGNVLSDMIDSGSIKVFSLTRVFRQAQESPIIRYAHRIRNGEMPQFEKARSGELSEFYFLETGRPEKVAQTIVQLCSTRIPQAFPHINDIQVLTPMHRGETGTINLNQQLQKALNPKRSKGLSAKGMMFRRDDKVMHLKNNYDKEVFNGDIGIVQEVMDDEDKLLVNYDNRIVEYDILELDELTLAYAVSVHKSQGSEYDAAIIALTTAHYPLLQRNLIYTAMTRGRNLVVIVGSTKAMKIALENDRSQTRLSSLKERLS